MRQLIFVGLLALAGCDQARTLGFVKNDPRCVHLMPAIEQQRMLAEAYPLTGYKMPDGEAPAKIDDALALDPMLHNWLLADCLITHARTMASSTDVSSVVAHAVATACRLESRELADEQSYENSQYGDEANNSDVFKAADEEALRYVIEARTLQCDNDRPDKDALGWPAKPEIQELE